MLHCQVLGVYSPHINCVRVNSQICLCGTFVIKLITLFSFLQTYPLILSEFLKHYTKTNHHYWPKVEDWTHSMTQQWPHKSRNASVRIASMATFIWRTWDRFQHLYKQGQYYKLDLQMTKQIQMVPGNNRVKGVWAPKACLWGCNVYPSSYNKKQHFWKCEKPRK